MKRYSVCEWHLRTPHRVAEIVQIIRRYLDAHGAGNACRTRCKGPLRHCAHFECRLQIRFGHRLFKDAESSNACACVVILQSRVKNTSPPLTSLQYGQTSLRNANYSSRRQKYSLSALSMQNNCRKCCRLLQGILSCAGNASTGPKYLSSGDVGVSIRDSAADALYPIVYRKIIKI
jgi:hypothetical protein